MGEAVADGDGDALAEGEGVGVDFFLAVGFFRGFCGVGVALGVGETVVLGEGDGVSVGDALGGAEGGGEAVGEGEGVGVCFFFVVDLFRCLCGVGEGPVKSLLIFAPNDS